MAFQVSHVKDMKVFTTALIPAVDRQILVERQARNIAMVAGPQDVPRLGALIQCFVKALKDHSFADFEDFETSMSDHPEILDIRRAGSLALSSPRLRAPLAPAAGLLRRRSGDARGGEHGAGKGGASVGALGSARRKMDQSAEDLCRMQRSLVSLAPALWLTPLTTACGRTCGSC
eukprot:s373_g15.t1